MPAVYKPRKKDCKYYVEEALRKIGYTVYSNVQNDLNDKECYVIYYRIGNEILTQESYWTTVFIKIVVNIPDNNDIPFIVDKIRNFVTKYVEDSGAPQCTSFDFRDINTDPLGLTTHVEIDAAYRYEIDWMNEI